jgi:Ca2+ transporting ATPase
MEGTGKMLVVAVGISSQTGIIYSLLGASEKKSKTDERKKTPSEDEGSEEDSTPAVKTKSDDDDEEQSVLQKKLTLIATRIGKVGKLPILR